MTQVSSRHCDWTPQRRKSSAHGARYTLGGALSRPWGLRAGAKVGRQRRRRDRNELCEDASHRRSCGVQFCKQRANC